MTYTVVLIRRPQTTKTPNVCVPSSVICVYTAKKKRRETESAGRERERERRNGMCRMKREKTNGERHIRKATSPCLRVLEVTVVAWRVSPSLEGVMTNCARGWRLACMLTRQAMCHISYSSLWSTWTWYFMDLPSVLLMIFDAEGSHGRSWMLQWTSSGGVLGASNLNVGAS